VTLLTYPRNSDSISVTRRRHFTGITFGDLTLRKLAHLTVIQTLPPIRDVVKTAAASGSEVRIWSRPQDTWNSGGVHPFTGGPSGLGIQ